MKTSWIIGIWILFIGGSIISGIVEMQYLSGSTDEAGVFTNLMTAPVLGDNVNLFTIIGAVIKITVGWVGAIWDMLWWDYAFFTGGWVIFKWVLLFPLSIGLITTIVMAIRGVGSN